jgi:hypothetical protein
VLLVQLDELGLKYECRVLRDDATKAARACVKCISESVIQWVSRCSRHTVGEIGRNCESPLLTLAHANETLVPSLDNLANADYGEIRELRRSRQQTTYG